MYLYYQPLPHLAAVLVYLLSFGLLSLPLAFNLTVVALWCLYPITTYLGARRFGLGDTASLLCAAAAPAVTSSLPFGFTLNSVMGLGLYTQTYAMVLFPMCLGWTWHALQESGEGRREAPMGEGERGWIGAAGLHVLVWLSHAFYGVAAATAAGFMLLARPGNWRTSLPRLLRIGVCTLVSLLFWLVPLAFTRDYAGGWPWDGVDRWEGWGARRVLHDLLLGRVFDQQQYVPFLSLALAGGLVVAALKLRCSPRLRALLVLFVLFVLFVIGRRSLGPLVDLQPANRGLQLFRYIGPLHAVGVMLAGLGLSSLASLLARWAPRPFALLAVALLLVSPLAALTRTGLAYFHTIRSYHVTDRDLSAAGEAIARARQGGVPGGRIYAHNKVETGAHLVAAAMALYTDLPMGQSYGLSMHDSLGFYYLEHLDPLDADGRALYNFRFALAAPESSLAKQQIAAGNLPLLRRKGLLVFALRGHYRNLQPVDLSLALAGSPRAIRPAALRWLSSGWPAEARFGLVLPDEASVPAWLTPVLRGRGEYVVDVREGKTWRPLQGWLPAPRARRGPPGRLLEEHADGYGGQVRMERPGAVALKVGYHPFWEAELDGQPAPCLHLSPCFLGVQVPTGVHEVSFRFRNPLYQKLLFLAAVLGWLAVGGAAAVRRRRRA
jgi:hypothetical protein